MKVLSTPELTCSEFLYFKRKAYLRTFHSKAGILPRKYCTLINGPFDLFCMNLVIGEQSIQKVTGADSIMISYGKGREKCFPKIFLTKNFWNISECDRKWIKLLIIYSIIDNVKISHFSYKRLRKCPKLTTKTYFRFN